MMQVHEFSFSHDKCLKEDRDWLEPMIMVQYFSVLGQVDIWSRVCYMLCQDTSRVIQHVK